MAKIEVVKQQDLQDCGACSLACIIEYYGGYVPLEKIREDTCTTTLGTTAYHLIEAAKIYGFEATGVKVEDLEDDNVYYPAIAHVILKNGLNHFVVVYKVSKTDIWLMDPARGKVKMKRKEFMAIWDHILILLAPISQILKYDQNITISSLLSKLISNNKFIFIKICIINILLMIFTILCSFYFQVAISSVNSGEDINFIKIMMLLFLWLTFMKVIISFVKNYYLIFFYKNLDIEIFTSFLEHIFCLPLKFIQNRTTGEIVSRVQDLSEIKDLLSDFFTNVLLNSILVIGSIVVLYSLSNDLFLALCLVVIIYLLIGLIFSKVIYSKVKENIEDTTEFNSVLVENIEMNISIKNLNLEKSFIKRLEDKLIAMLKSNLKTQKCLTFISVFKDFAYEIGLFFVTTFGIYLIYQKELDVLTFITFNGIILYLFNPIREFIDLIPKYNYLKASFRKLMDFINVKGDQKNDGIKSMSNGEISFHNVTYSYNLYTNILENLSFSIKSGEKVLLIGSSGSGKSTICNLLSFPYDVKFGIIKLSGVNAADYSLGTIQKEILYVGQNENLFTGTIRENITCFREIEESDFLKVAAICKLEEIVHNKPNRYSTVINGKINNLSGGEKQRIILARALLKKAKIIILDEALSEVDIFLEEEIIEQIKQNFLDKTLLYVSHKDVRSKFDRILNMEEINGI